MGAVVGRSAELASIGGALSDAAAGRGGLVVVTGEAGIGKTTLVAAAGDHALSTGATVVQGYAVDDPGAPVLWPWRRVARQVPELDAVLAAVAAPELDDDAVRFTVSEAVADVLRRVAPPAGLVLVLEDLHWADSLTVAVLRHVALDLGWSRVLVVATARDDPSTSFGRALPDLLRGPTAQRIPLRGFGARDVVAWFASDGRPVPGGEAVEELVARTDGNPFLIRALTSAPSATSSTTGPDGAADATDSVLAGSFLRLPPDVRTTVAVAALSSERLSPRLLAASRGVTVSTVSAHVSAGTRAGLLQHGPTGLSFVHALVRDAVVAALDPVERVELEAAIARAMEDSGDDDLVGASAVHWDRAAGPEASRRCRERARTAAARASAARAHEEAVELARLGLRHTRRLGVEGDGLAEELVDLARYEWLANLLPAALATCAEAVDVAEAVGRPDLMARAALVPQGMGSVETALVADGLCRRTLAVLPEDALADRARLLGVRAVAAAERATDGSAEPLSAAALDLARRSGSAQAELEAVAARHFVLSYPQAVAERTNLAERAVELGRSSPTALGGLWGHLWQADIALQRGDLQLLHRCVGQIGRVADLRSSPVGRWHRHRLRWVRAALVGSFDEARAEAEHGRMLAERIGDVSMVGSYVAFRIQLGLLRGDPTEVPPTALPLLESVPDIPILQAIVARTLTLLGERAGAVTLLGTLRDVPDRLRLGPRWAGTVGQVGLAAAALGDADLARRCHDVLAPVAPWYGGDGGGTPFTHGSNELSLGELALAADDPATAAGHFARGIEADLRLGARPFTALGRIRLAQSLVRLDVAEPSRVEALVGLALPEVRILDMPGPLGEAEALLGAGRSVAGSAPALTARELEVARLVGRARTNRQIAQELFVSVRTVESHVRSALSKLGLTSRTELALWVTRHGRSAE